MTQADLNFKQQFDSRSVRMGLLKLSNLKGIVKVRKSLFCSLACFIRALSYQNSTVSESQTHLLYLSSIPRKGIINSVKLLLVLCIVLSFQPKVYTS